MSSIKLAGAVPWVLALFTGLAACSPQSDYGQIDVEGAHGVVNGDLQKKGSLESKSVVALREFGGKASCSASILSNRILLTAAHCVDGEEVQEGKLEAVFDVNGDSRSAKSIKVEKVLVHPKHKPFNFGRICLQNPAECKALTVENTLFLNEYDLAVLLLNDEIPSNYAPVNLELDKEVVASQKQGMAMGYGKSTNKGGTGQLRSMKSSLVHFDKTAKIFIKSTKKQGVCNGDSGGPLFVTIGKKLVQIGVASHNTGSNLGGPCNSQGAAYVNLAANAEWIKSAPIEILQQKKFMMAPWQNIKAGVLVMTLTSADEWIMDFVKDVGIECQSSSVKLAGRLKIYPTFQSESRYVGEAGTGASDISLQIKGKTSKFSFDQAVDPYASRNETKITMHMPDNVFSTFRKSGLNPAKTWAEIMNGQAISFSAQKNDVAIYVNGDIEKPFKVSRVSANQVVLTSSNSVITTSKIEEKASCEVTMNVQ